MATFKTNGPPDGVLARPSGIWTKAKMCETYHESGRSAGTAVGVLCQVQRWITRCDMTIRFGASAALLRLRLYSANQRAALST